MTTPNGRIRHAYVHPLSKELAGLLFGQNSTSLTLQEWQERSYSLLMRMAAVLDDRYKRRWSTDRYAANDRLTDILTPAVLDTLKIKYLMHWSIDPADMVKFDEPGTEPITHVHKVALIVTINYQPEPEIIPGWIFNYADGMVRFADYAEQQELEAIVSRIEAVEGGSDDVNQSSAGSES